MDSPNCSCEVRVGSCREGSPTVLVVANIPIPEMHALDYTPAEKKAVTRPQEKATMSAVQSKLDTGLTAARAVQLRQDATHGRRLSNGVAPKDMLKKGVSKKMKQEKAKAEIDDAVPEPLIQYWGEEVPSSTILITLQLSATPATLCNRPRPSTTLYDPPQPSTAL